MARFGTIREILEWVVSEAENADRRALLAGHDGAFESGSHSALEKVADVLEDYLKEHSEERSPLYEEAGVTPFAALLFVLAAVAIAGVVVWTLKGEWVQAGFMAIFATVFAWASVEAERSGG